MMRLITVLAVGLYALALGRDGFDHWVDTTVVPDLQAQTSVQVLAQSGQPLRVFTVEDGRWRLDITPDRVDPLFQSMLVAYEDKRFYDHTGVDPWALARAAWQAIWNGRIVSGASTLSMQTARLIEGGTTGKITGKLRQMRLALALERRLSKDEILQHYVLRAPYGGNVEGLAAASMVWFGRPAGRLTPAQAALLVALPQSPETRRPDRFPNRAKTARDTVLHRVAQAGVIDASTLNAALQEPIPTHQSPMPAHAPHLAQRFAKTGAGVVRTTLDYDLQIALERFARSTVNALPSPLSMAIVVADHRSGEIRAHVGSAHFGAVTARQGFVDMTRATRSPGSTLKPAIYGLAFDQGIAHPETLIYDQRAHFGGYAPQNFDGEFKGEITLATALKQSRNIPPMKLLHRIGPNHLVKLMQQSGATPKGAGPHPGLAVGLGGVGVTLEDLVQIYAMLAQQGQKRPLSPTGPTPLGPRVMGDVAAWYVGDILSQLPPPDGMADIKLAYKTGTSYGHRDTWAIGYDGAHVAGVWIGRPDGTAIPGAVATDLAAPALFQVFGRLHMNPPLPKPPMGAIVGGRANLPVPLQHFERAGPAAKALEFDFPPNGAQVARDDGGFAARVRGGAPPFIWLLNGAPVATQARHPHMFFDAVAPGFTRVSVIDAKGATATITIRLD